jgi:hypothetical protein
MVVKLLALRAGHILPPRRFLVLILVTGQFDPGTIVRLERLGQLENPVASSGIEPATFRINQQRYRVPELGKKIPF